MFLQLFKSGLSRSLASLNTISFWLKRCSKDRKSTRLNSSHDQISYAVFCLKKKNFFFFFFFFFFFLFFFFFFFFFFFLFFFFFFSFFFFFNDTATTEIYTLSLHDALPISVTLGNFIGGVIIGVMYYLIFKKFTKPAQ